MTQYRDDGFLPLDTNERGRREDLDVAAGLAQTGDIAEWQTTGRTLRDGETAVPNHGLLLTWAAGGQPLYALSLPDGQAAAWRLSADHSLTFTLANMGDAPAGGVWVEVESAGAVARLPLEPFGSLPLPLPAQLTKADWIAGLPSYKIATDTPYERVDQTYDLPLSAFVTANPDIRPDSLSAVRFLFDGQVDGRLLLDEIGFRAP